MPGSASVTDRTLHSWQKAKLYLYETAYSAWREIRTVTDVQLSTEVEEAPDIQEFRDGEIVSIDRMNISKRLRVRFKPQVIADPSVNTLLLGGASTLVAGAGENLTFLYNFGDSPIFLPPGVTSGATCATDTPVGVAATIGGAAVPAATYKYAITCVYGTTESDAPAACKTANIVVGLPDNAVALTWLHDVLLGVPDSYNIYREDQAAPGVWAYMGNTAAHSFVDIFPAGVAATLPTGTPLTVKDLTLVTTYVIGVDYDYDAAHGRLLLHSGTTIDKFQPVIIGCAVLRPSSVTQPLDAASWEASYNKIRLEQLRDVSDVPTGVVIDLYRVKTNGGSVTLSMLERDLSSYDSVEWEAFWDDILCTYGQIATWNANIVSIT